MSDMKDNKIDLETLDNVTGGKGGWNINPWGNKGIGWSNTEQDTNIDASKGGKIRNRPSNQNPIIGA
ncbi:MAG: hypothetical protein K6E49_08245 [Lachnospiraceae bacterium]|nr:hypothetical protein [Lachnospiraceae bacterium]